MRKLIFAFFIIACCSISYSRTNKVHIAIEKPIDIPSGIVCEGIKPIAPVVWNNKSITPVLTEQALETQVPSIKMVNEEEPIETTIPMLFEVAIQSIFALNPTQTIFLCVNPEAEVEFNYVNMLRAHIEKEISISPNSYMMLPIQVSSRSLHWAYQALNPRYCSTIYGIYLEMQSYEKKGLPIPKELYDRMNKAVDFYFLMEEAKARRADRRKK